MKHLCQHCGFGWSQIDFSSFIRSPRSFTQADWIILYAAATLVHLRGVLAAFLGEMRFPARRLFRVDLADAMSLVRCQMIFRSISTQPRTCASLFASAGLWRGDKASELLLGDKCSKPKWQRRCLLENTTDHCSMGQHVLAESPEPLSQSLTTTEISSIFNTRTAAPETPETWPVKCLQVSTETVDV